MTSSGTERDSDERFAWKAALGVMIFISIVTAILRSLGLFPFQDVFAAALVGIPTVVLLVGWLKWKPSIS